MIPIREGFALNLSFLRVSDFIVIILALLAAGFGLISEKRMKNPWVRTIVYVAGAFLLILILRLVLPAGNFLGNAMGTILVHWYGVLIMGGAILAAFMAAWGAKRRGMDPNFIWDMLPWLLIAGIVGARIWHILTPPQSMIEMGITTQYYLTHPLDAIAVWNGGLGIPGAVIGGVLALWVYCLVKKQKFSFWLDVLAPGLLAAQIIGRIGNFLNQELYGRPSNLPWAIFIDPGKRLPQYINVATYHPLFAYEMFLNLVILGIILFLTVKVAKKLIDGDIFLLYLMLYAFARFNLEFLRLDYSSVDGININQTLMAIVFVFAIVLFILKHTVFVKRTGLGLTDYHEALLKEKTVSNAIEKKQKTTSKTVAKKDVNIGQTAKPKSELKGSGTSKKK